MRIHEAFRRPFSDTQKLVIGILLSIIPFVDWIAKGYVLESARMTLNKKKGLPKWEAWGDLFVNGVLMTVISLIYLIPYFILFILFIVNVGNVSGAVFFALSMLALLITIYVLPAAILEYAWKYKFKAAFKQIIWKKAFSEKYVAAWLFAMLINLGMGLVLIIIFFLIMGKSFYTGILGINPGLNLVFQIIGGIFGFYFSMVTYTLIAQNYAQITKRGK
jgi:hypothetical protein